MRRSPFTSVLFALLVSVSPAAFAASFIVPSDSALVRSAPAIVVGTAGDSRSFIQAGEIYTRTTLSIHESIRGPLGPGQTIDVVGMGGVLEDRFVIVSGVPRFAEGERVLLFLTKNSVGQWAVKDLMLGKFTFAHWEGLDLLVRGVGSEHVFGWTPDGKMHDEALRAAGPFLEFVRDVADDGVATTLPDYIRTQNARGTRITADRFLEENAEPNAYLTTVTLADGQQIGFRWRQFDNGQSVSFRRDGVQPGFTESETVSSIERAMGAWNNQSGTPISYQLGGTTNGGFVINDGTNAVVFNKPFPAEAGSAIGFAKWSGGTVYTRNGSSFIATNEGDVIIRNTVSGQTLLDEVLCHELGHTLGFRHSNEGTPSSNDAVMRSTATGTRGANLGSWDLEATNAVYGEGGSTCTPPAISSQPQSITINSGNSTTLSVSASGTAPLSYQWSRRPAGSGSFTNISGATSASLNTGALTESTDFRVVITNACGNVTSSTATVTVQQCNAPAFTAHPQSATIQSGQSTTLSVSVTGTNPVSLQWYRRTGTSGSFSAISGATSSSLNTGTLTQTMSYFVRATNSCGTTDSAVATITVQATCVAPSITSQPQDAALPAGGGQVTLSVGASGTTPLTVIWYRSSTSGTVQVGTGTSLTVTQAGNYFASISNQCGSVDSRIATVSATQCNPIVILLQPQSQQITSGGSVTLAVDQDGTAPFTYQWYRGNRGDTSNPVAGATSRTFTTPALTQNTTYWVRITNCAGSVDSQAATISIAAVCTAPAITQQPQSSTIAPGQRATLSVTATGTSLQYQWFRGNRGNEANPIAGATSRTFTTPALTQSTSYWVRVRNSCGTVHSQTATVKVQSSRRRGVRPPGFN